MNGFKLLNQPPIYIEFGHDFVRLLNGQSGREFPVERQPDGRLAPASRECLKAEIAGLLKRSIWQPRTRAICAIGARGASLRRLAIPASAGANLHHVLRLQIEAEFPLSPDDLAWGYQQLGSAPRQPGASQELLVAAVKKEVVEDYVDVLTACALSPVLALAPLARSYLFPHPPSGCVLLDIGRSYSELTVLDYAGPVAVRSLQWGEEAIVGALKAAQGTQRTENPDDAGADAGPNPPGNIAAAMVLDKLSAAIKPHTAGRKIYITGAKARAIAPELAGQLRLDCEPVETALGEGRSAAIFGLRQAFENNGGLPLLTLQAKAANGAAAVASPTPLKWGALAAALGLAVLLLPQVEALVLKPGLSGRLAALKADRARLPVIDRELDFLRYLKQNQPDYLDALYIFAKTAPPGTRFDSLSMNRRGDVSLRAKLRTPDQAVDFRSKLVESGFFSNVAVEEQVPAPNHQGLSLRMSAQIKPASERLSLAILKGAQAPGKKASTNAASSKASAKSHPARPASAKPTAPTGGKPEKPNL